MQPAAQPDIQPDNTLLDNTIVVEESSQLEPLQRPQGCLQKQPQPPNFYIADITIYIPNLYL